jgi:hypothetical protein
MPDFMMQPEYVPTSVMAMLIGRSTMSLYRYERQNIGMPPPVKINGRKLYHRRSILAWMESMQDK